MNTLRRVLSSFEKVPLADLATTGSRSSLNNPLTRPASIAFCLPCGEPGTSRSYLIFVNFAKNTWRTGSLKISKEFAVVAESVIDVVVAVVDVAAAIVVAVVAAAVAYEME